MISTAFLSFPDMIFVVDWALKFKYLSINRHGDHYLHDLIVSQILTKTSAMFGFGLALEPETFNHTYAVYADEAHTTSAGRVIHTYDISEIKYWNGSVIWYDLAHNMNLSGVTNQLGVVCERDDLCKT